MILHQSNDHDDDETMMMVVVTTTIRCEFKAVWWRQSMRERSRGREWKCFRLLRSFRPRTDLRHRQARLRYFPAECLRYKISKKSGYLILVTKYWWNHCFLSSRHSQILENITKMKVLLHYSSVIMATRIIQVHKHKSKYTYTNTNT